jgi:hypothetical protein
VILKHVGKDGAAVILPDGHVEWHDGTIEWHEQFP